MMKFSRLVARLGGIGFGLLLAVLVLEVMFRLFYAWLPINLQLKTANVRTWGIGGPPLATLTNTKAFYDTCIGDERLFARMLPGLEQARFVTGPQTVWHVSTEKLTSGDAGFRIPKDVSTWDGVVVGDSFAFCFGVETQDCWVNLLSKATGLSFANLGVVGTGSVSHQRYLEDYGLALNPEIVIWQFYINDFNNDFQHIVRQRQGCARTGSQTLPTGTATQKLKAWLKSTFIAYELIARPLAGLLARQEKAVESATIPEWWQVTTDAGVPLLVHKYDIEETIWQEGADLTKNAILSAHKQAAQHGSRFLLMLVPANFQVYAETIADERVVVAADLWDSAMDDLILFAEDNDIEYIDLRLPLREAARQGIDLYPADDGHWTPDGNGFVAALLGSRINQMLHPK